jgi:hypothetical protein
VLSAPRYISSCLKGKDRLKIILIIASLLFSNVAIAQNEIKMSDKEEVSDIMTRLVKAINKADSKSACNLFLSTNQILQEAIFDLTENGVELYADFQNIEKIEDGKLKVNIIFSARSGGWNAKESNGSWKILDASAYFTFEKYEGNWLISDTNLYKKTNEEYESHMNKHESRVNKISFLIFLATLPIYIFWSWMLIDCMRNEKNHKFIGMFLIIFLSIIGATIYFFTLKRKRLSIAQKNKK